MKRANKTKLPADAYDRTPRFTITVTDETCWLTRHDLKGKPATTYPVGMSSLGGAFNAFEASTGLLPENVLFWQRKHDAERVAIWLPPTRRTITWRSGKRAEKLTVPLPGFVFIGAGVQYSIFAAPKRPASERDTLYTAPLPNVHGDGTICAGNVVFPRCALATIQQAADLFFGSEFNHDLSSGKVAAAHRQPMSRNTASINAAVGGGQSLLQFYRALAGEKRFPMQRLVTQRNGMADMLGTQRQPATLADVPVVAFTGVDELGDVEDGGVEDGE